jgi:hypothetical protein
MSCLQPDEKMDVICDAADFLRNSAEPLDRTPDVFMQSFDPRVFDEWSAILSTEDDVEVQAQIR